MSGNSKKFSTDTPTLAEIRRRKKPNRRSIDITLDPEIARQIHQKETEIEEAQKQEKRHVGKSLADHSPIPQLEKELAALQEEAKDTTATFWFKDIGKKPYDDLITDNPPTKEQKDEWKDEGGEGSLAYNPETFVPALIAACSDGPEISLKEANEICDEFGTGEVIALFQTAMAVCIERVSAPKLKSSQTVIDEISTTG